MASSCLNLFLALKFESFFERIINATSYNYCCAIWQSDFLSAHHAFGKTLVHGGIFGQHYERRKADAAFSAKQIMRSSEICARTELRSAL